jgi:hypothetical protein
MGTMAYEPRCSSCYRGMACPRHEDDDEQLTLTDEAVFRAGLAQARAALAAGIARRGRS